jgi:recombination protein RecA
VPTRQQKATAKALKAITAKFPKGTAKRGSSSSSSDIRDVIATGIEVLDHYILGIGGLPAGRVGELFSDEGAGKTSLGFAALAGAQRAGGVAALIETEKTLVRARATVFGVSLPDLILFEPTTVEEVLEGIRTLFDAIPKNVGPNMVVWDSLASTELAGQVGKPIGDSKLVGRKARLMSEALPLLSRLAREKNAGVLVVNQLREKIGVMFGPAETTPAGHALKFHSSYRLQLWRGKALKVGGDPAGILTTAKAVKSKVGLPFRKAKLRLDFDSGWANEWALLNLGKDLKILGDGARASKANLDKVRRALGYLDSVGRLGGDLEAAEEELAEEVAQDAPQAPEE